MPRCTGAAPPILPNESTPLAGTAAPSGTYSEVRPCDGDAIPQQTEEVCVPTSDIPTEQIGETE